MIYVRLTSPTIPGGMHYLTKLRVALPDIVRAQASSQIQLIAEATVPGSNLPVNNTVSHRKTSLKMVIAEAFVPPGSHKMS